MKLKQTLLAVVGASLIAGLTAQAQVPGVNSALNSVFNLVYDNSTMKPTYSATSYRSPASAATDFCLLTGSASKTVKVRRVIIGGASTAVQTEPVSIIRRSTVATTGTGTTATPAVYDTTNSLSGSTSNAATAVMEIFTANPTVGTYVSTLMEAWLQTANLSTGVGQVSEIRFGERGSPVVLRGAAQNLVVNLNGITYSGGTLSCTFEWTEE